MIKSAPCSIKRPVKLGLMGLGLLFALGVSAIPAHAQDSGVANTAVDFESADNDGGLLGSGTSIWDLFHSAGALRGAGQVDDGFRRSQNRRINSQAESFRERQRALIEQREAEAATEIPVTDSEPTE